MNERIKEIMLAHGLHKYISDDCQNRIDQLSLLIIKECAKVAREYTLIKSGLTSDFTGTVYIEDEILNHFGVTNERQDY